MSRATPEATIERVLTNVRQRLLEIERSYRAVGRSVADGGIRAIVQRMTAAIPAPSPVNAIIGPFYRTEQVARLLGISRQAVFDRVTRRTLLGLKTRDRVWVYPVFQFEGREVLPDLAAVLGEFASGDVDPWAVAAWLASPETSLAGRRPLDCLRESRDIERVRALARAAFRRWTR